MTAEHPALTELADLGGRVAVVTGAARGFGAAIADRLAEAGATVMIADVRLDEAAATAARIADRTGAACGAQHLDVTDETSISGAFADWHSTWGALDILVNNAGVFSNHLAHEMPVSELDRILTINVRGAYLCTRAALGPMRAAGRGVIVNVASVDAMVTSAEGLTHYTTSKHAIAGMTRSIAVEAAPLGVRINAVCPGAAMTEGAVEFIAGGQETGIDVVAQWDGIVERTPLGRLCDVDDVARAVVFLASDMAAFVTGVLLPVDGGILVQPLEGYVPHTEDA
ncbi:MAG: SDR family NAD(P)-dependent oxidoreductase [bacterium]|nr:SDR family NAD(P)-dependent oxidoreductase [bacterium]